MDLNNLLKKSIILQSGHLIIIAIFVIIFVSWIWRRIQMNHNPLKLEDEHQVIESDTAIEDEDDFIPALDEKDHISYKGATVTMTGGARQFYDMVQNRRSVRAFKPHPIPSLDIINDCLRAAGTSPSGAHTEPWTFCVVSRSELKQQIREIIESEEELNYSQRMHRQWTTDLRPLKTNYIKPYLTDAPYLILIFKQTYGFNKFGKRKQHYYNEISVSIATGILLCALQAAGLSSLVTTPLNCGPALRILLNRPKNEKLLVLLPVGYPAEDCRIPDLQRKHLEEISVTY